MGFLHGGRHGRAAEISQFWVNAFGWLGPRTHSRVLNQSRDREECGARRCATIGPMDRSNLGVVARPAVDQTKGTHVLAAVKFLRTHRERAIALLDPQYHHYLEERILS